MSRHRRCVAPAPYSRLRTSSQLIPWKMADGASLLDEELSSFVFSYLTENPDSQYEEEEVSSDRLDVDFPDIDLLQLDTSDFDSVSCLSELHWCHDQQDSSSTSIQYSTGDPELFEIEEENAALLAALTDSLDEMVEDEVGGGLCGFPVLGGDPEEEAEEDEEEDDEEEDLPLDSEPFHSSLSPETEDPSLLKKLLLSPPNVPAGLDAQKEGGARRHSNRSQHLKPLRASVKVSENERKAHAARPAGPQCTELHRFLVTTREAEDAPCGDTEEDSESEPEGDEEEEEDGDAQESSGTEDDCRTAPQPAECQFSSEKELRGMVELIRYMHTYCLPSRKQCTAERRERECPNVARKARPDCPQARPPPPVSHKAANQTAGGGRPRLAFIRRREVKGHSLLRELLETVRSFDVSKPYRLQSPPYSHTRGTAARPVLDRKADAPACRPAKMELKDSSSKSPVDEGTPGPVAVQSSVTRKSASGDASFSVRRSQRLASFPGRFAKKAWAGSRRPRAESDSEWWRKEVGSVKQRSTDLSVVIVPFPRDSCRTEPQKSEDMDSPCSQNGELPCRKVPLPNHTPAPHSTSEAQDSSKPFEQTTLSVELCGTAGLTPPTTPPHEPFKADGRAEVCPRGSWLSRTHSRKLPEQTELYAQLRRMGQAGDVDAGGLTSRAFGDHDYCMQGLGDGLRKLPAALLSPSRETGKEEEVGLAEGMDCGFDPPQAEPFSKVPDPLLGTESKGDACPTATAGSRSPQALSPCSADVGADDPAQTPTAIRSDQPPSPNSQLSFSCDKSEMCHGEEQRAALDDCRVFYIHNLPSGITQAMLRRRFGALGEPKECKIVVKNEERCGVITIRQPPSGPRLRRRWEPAQHNGGSSARRFGRKRYIDLDEAGPGPVKSKYDALDFDTLLKEAQRSLHR
ncbi:hypothetical protein GN956_G15554 [Arapaima gigas]